jgi:hypothetical protein
MISEASGHSIEVVRGRLGEERAEGILRFWSDLGALGEEDAQRRLPEVACVLVGGDGEVAGVNSVFPGTVELLGGRLFWIYRSLLAPTAADAWRAMHSEAYGVLASEFDPERGGPIGVCAAISDRATMKRYPEAEWADPRTLYAGYLPDGSQVRVAYFAGAKI